MSIEKDIGWYRNCTGAEDLVTAIHAYAMINTESSAGTAMDWAKALVHQDGKNRSVTDDNIEVNNELENSNVEVDAYYQLALQTAFNSFLIENRESMYYPTYSQTLAILLINVGAKEMISGLQLDPGIMTKTENILSELSDMVFALVKKAKDECRKLQPKLLDRFNDLGVNVLNEATTVVISRWFTDQSGKSLIGKELKLVLQGLRADYLRLIKPNGHVELSILLKLYGVSSSTYQRYRKEVISKIIPKCDAAVLQYVKHIMLTK